MADRLTVVKQVLEEKEETLLKLDLDIAFLNEMAKTIKNKSEAAQINQRLANMNAQGQKLQDFVDFLKKQVEAGEKLAPEQPVQEAQPAQ